MMLFGHLGRMSFGTGSLRVSLQGLIQVCIWNLVSGKGGKKGCAHKTALESWPGTGGSDADRSAERRANFKLNQAGPNVSAPRWKESLQIQTWSCTLAGSPAPGDRARSRSEGRAGMLSISGMPDEDENIFKCVVCILTPPLSLVPRRLLSKRNLTHKTVAAQGYARMFCVYLTGWQLFYLIKKSWENCKHKVIQMHEAVKFRYSPYTFYKYRLS